MKRKYLHLLMLINLVMVAGWFGWQQVKQQGANWLPVKYVRIEGAFQYIAKERIKLALKGQVNKGLYNADIQQIQASVEQLPWVNSVQVKRIWPDAIDIKIVEQIPVVRWGRKGLLNDDGETFTPSNIEQFKPLPLLFAPVGKKKAMLEVMKQLIAELNERQMKLIEFQVSERRAWKIKLDNNMELKLGRNEPLNKFKRFLNTFALIGKEQITKVAVVDLRYPNGYALAWKENTIDIDWKKVAMMNNI